MTLLSKCDQFINRNLGFCFCDVSHPSSSSLSGPDLFLKKNVYNAFTVLHFLRPHFLLCGDVTLFLRG